MKRFLEGCRRALRFLAVETIVFVAGVEMAEAHPEAAFSLAETCMGLVGEAMHQIDRYGGKGKDEHLQKAYGELEVANELFRSIVEGESASTGAREFIPQGAEDKRVLILDIAHSHTHRAIDALKKSKNLQSYRELLQLLSKARRDSAPSTLYRVAYEIAVGR